MTRYLSIITALLIILGSAASCSRNESADASDLLATVPSDASVVAVANLRSILEKSGCKTDGSSITPSEDVKKVIAGIKDTKSRTLAETFFNGNSGVDPSVALFFTVGYYKYITGIAADPDKFKAAVSARSGEAFTSAEGMDVCGNVALKGNQFWINIESTSIDARETLHFATLSQEQSFLSKSSAEALSSFDTDIQGWANIAGALNAGSFGFQERAMIQVALQTIFKDAVDADFSLSFDKGEMTSRLGVTDSKGKPAKYLLASGTLDLNTISRIGGNADALLAICVPHKLIEQLRKDSGSKSASVLGAYLTALGAIDGTVAVAADIDTNAVKGVISTDGGSTAALNSFLNEMGLDVKIDGKLISISKGTISRGIPVDELAKQLKGAMAGFACVNPRPGKSQKVEDQLKDVAVTLQPKSQSVELNIKARTTTPEENFLVTILRSVR